MFLGGSAVLSHLGQCPEKKKMASNPPLGILPAEPIYGEWSVDQTRHPGVTRDAAGGRIQPDQKAPSPQMSMNVRSFLLSTQLALGNHCGLLPTLPDGGVLQPGLGLCRVWMPWLLPGCSDLTYPGPTQEGSP